MKIGIIGLGLIGGSIYKKLMSLGHTVIGISKSQNGKAENITNDFSQIQDCEIIFVATAMNKTLSVLDKLEHRIPCSTIVTDVCSLKEFVTKKERPYNFIPSHPMAGTEFQGYENADEELFNCAKWVLTPKNDIGVDKLSLIIKSLGAKPIITTPKEHDEAVAIISHMPMVVSQALIKLASQNELALKLASSGFRDMTRLALSNTEMATDMVNLNHNNIEISILRLYSELGDLMKDNYPQEITKLKELREHLYKNGINIRGEEE